MCGNLASEKRGASWKNILLASGITLFFLLLLFGLFTRAMTRELNRDEGQFIAAGALLARHGYLPYQDYPFFHLPNLALVFAALFTKCDHLLLAGRCFNVACGWLLLVLIFCLTANAFRKVGSLRWIIAGLAAITLFANRLFLFTSGRAWNHDLPVLAGLAALAALLVSNRERGRLFWLGLAGFLLGVAIGARLSFAPLVAPFTFFIVYQGATRNHRLRDLALFAVTLFIALAPMWILWARAPTQFVFDNFVYNGKLNRLYQSSIGAHGVWLSRRLLFPFELLKFPQNDILVLAFIYLAIWLPARANWRIFLRDPSLGPVVLSLPFLLLGAIAPSPSYKQYYYALVPFLLLGVVLGLARAWFTIYGRRAGVVSGLLSAASVISLISDLPLFASTQGWTPLRVHQIGQNLSALTKGEILTLVPVFPLEGNARIYKEFATGPFAWRVAPLVPEQLRATIGFVDATDLETYLATAPPAAILTGGETSVLEQPLNDYAKQHGYRLRRVSGLYLWVR
jgi:4-amino-4-deoxy-L-arabinose transferase-like glycosyltransferase